MALQDFVWVTQVEGRHGACAAAPLRATLPGLAERKPFRNSRGHGLRRGALVSFGFPARQTLGGSPLLQRRQRHPHADPEATPMPAEQPKGFSGNCAGHRTRCHRASPGWKGGHRGFASWRERGECRLILVPPRRLDAPASPHSRGGRQDDQERPPDANAS